MGTFKDSLKKWFYTQNTSPTVSDVSRIPLLNTSGDPVGSSTLKQILSIGYGVSAPQTSVMLVGFNESGITIAPLGKVGSNLAQHCIGAAIVHNEKVIIVSGIYNSQLSWGNASSGGSGNKYTLASALTDFNGKTNTEQQVQTLGSNATAAKWCQDFYPSAKGVAETHPYFGKGRWYMPSLGELMVILAHYPQLKTWFAYNSLGSFPSSHIMSSTEQDASNIWYYNSGNNTFAQIGKNSTSMNVLPITTIY